MNIKQLLISITFLILIENQVALGASTENYKYVTRTDALSGSNSQISQNNGIIDLYNDVDNQTSISTNTDNKTISSCAAIVTSTGEVLPLNNITTDGAEVSNGEIVTINSRNTVNDSQLGCPAALIQNTALINPIITNSIDDISKIKIGELDVATLNQISLPPGAVIISNTFKPNSPTAISNNNPAPPPVSIITPVPPNPSRRLIAERHRFVPGTITLAHSFSGAEANRLTQAGITIGCNTANNYLNLDNGNVLFSPDADIVIGTGKGTVSIGSGATVFIMESDKDVVLYDLHQTKPKQVCITINKERLIMEPGRMLVLTKQKTNDFKKLSVNCHAVPYRKAQELDLEDNTITVFAADFSICSALTRLQPLKKLLSSTDKREQSIVDSVLKGAITLEAYTHHS